MSLVGIPRVRFDVCCNDPDNGLFAHVAEQLQVTTWDGADLELECMRKRAPKFTEMPGRIRLLRRNYPILASTHWYGNWCWNAYWLEPSILVELLMTIQTSGMFHCCDGPSQLYNNWNEGVFDKSLWLANFLGRHSIGIIDG